MKKRTLAEMKHGLFCEYDGLDAEDFEGVISVRKLIDRALGSECVDDRNDRLAARLVYAMTGEDYDKMLLEVIVFIEEYNLNEMSEEDRELLGWSEEKYKKMMNHIEQGKYTERYDEWIKCLLFIHKKVL